MRLIRLLLVLFSIAGVVPAQPAKVDPKLEALTRETAAELRCPVCQGLSIQDSPSELALEMKSVVREQLAAGKTPAQVKQFFIDKYGEWILLEPKPKGVNLLVYLLPLTTVAGGGLFVWRFVNRLTEPKEAVSEG